MHPFAGCNEPEKSINALSWDYQCAFVGKTTCASARPWMLAKCGPYIMYMKVDAFGMDGNNKKDRKEWENKWRN